MPKCGTNKTPNKTIEAELSFDDIEHYQKITVALGDTIKAMAAIDEIIDAHGGWPIK